MERGGLCECDWCAGRGFIERDTVDAKGEYEGDEDICERCEGTGEHAIIEEGAHE
jgi:DnaJ-class molecular chaperone